MSQSIFFGMIVATNNIQDMIERFGMIKGQSGAGSEARYECARMRQDRPGSYGCYDLGTAHNTDCIIIAGVALDNQNPLSRHLKTNAH